MIFLLDGTREILEVNQNLYDKVIFNKKNCGKGAAIINSLRHITGDYVLIQDADLEYNPEDYEKPINPVKYHSADVVYGTRFKGSEAKRILYFKNRLANFLR